MGQEVTGERLLIVDDAPGMREVLGMKLEREGYRVAIADGSVRAGELIDAEAFDLILLDIRLPDGSGLDLLGRLRARHSPLDLPVIVISGLDQSDDVVNALAQGANDYIVKPIDLPIVVARIRTQLTARRMKQVNDHFLRIVSHDLQKPLVIMLDVARELRADFPEGSAMRADGLEALEILIDSGQHMQAIVSDLLELGALRHQRLRITRRPTDLGAVARQAVARNRPYAASKGGELRMEFARDLPNIPGDDARLTQVLENLIGNAIKFSPPGSVTTVRVLPSDGWAICEVSDTGPGIPDKELALLFREYARGSNAPTGGEQSTGLGLSICRELVLLHGGEIGARNNAEGGATFWFRLPLA